MSDNLRVQLGKSKIENQSTWHGPWPPEVWEAARRAYSSGWRQPQPRFPVIIKAGTVLSTAEDLKNLTDMTTVPEVITTTTAPFRYDKSHVPETVHICDVDRRARNYIRQHTTCDALLVWFHGKTRYALEVHSLEPNGVNYPGPQQLPNNVKDPIPEITQDHQNESNEGAQNQLELSSKNC
ncbi:hypothetical protein GGR51DRAFT_234576 [Nemania sp. FL0031]|nr:hypothetical protein GGR51DRAFT_234576 [Nemania sp. FL0031]